MKRHPKPIADDGSKLYTTDKLERIYEKFDDVKVGVAQPDGSVLKEKDGYKLFCYENVDILFEGDHRLKIFPK